MASSWRDQAATLLWAGIFILLPALVAWHDSGARAPAVREVVAHQRPSTPPPVVEPLEIRQLTPEDARAFNATIPFSTAPNPAARPYRFAGTDGDRERALTCLAAAQYYEAGDDPVGQRAVAQVVLNRVRHPAFPKSICGVVFQGAERTTGCQFTFSCDGSMARFPPDAAWERARRLAGQMLSGAVYRPVGLATHYHTDWVVPYWSGSLVKIAEVHSHLFFRWPGYWGTPSAFSRRGDRTEPAIQLLASLAPAHMEAAGSDAMLSAVGGNATQLASAPQIYSTASGTAPPRGLLFKGVRLVAIAPEDNAFVIELPASVPVTSYDDIARTFCSGRSQCRIMAWRAGTGVPTGFPLQTADLQRMRFSYIHNADSGLQRMLWNCDLAPAPVGGRCMKERIPVSRLASPVKQTGLNPARTSPGSAP